MALSDEARHRALATVTRIDAISKTAEGRSVLLRDVMDVSTKLRDIAHEELAWMVRHGDLAVSDAGNDMAVMYTMHLAALEASCRAFLDGLPGHLPQAQAMVIFEVMALSHMRGIFLTAGARPS